MRRDARRAVRTVTPRRCKAFCRALACRGGISSPPMISTHRHQTLPVGVQHKASALLNNTHDVREPLQQRQHRMLFGEAWARNTEVSLHLTSLRHGEIKEMAYIISQHYQLLHHLGFSWLSRGHHTTIPHLGNARAGTGPSESGR